MLEEAKRIVLVDDEPGVLESIQTGIDWEKLGTRICGAFTDGQKALDYIEENPVDILITMAAVDANTHQEGGIMQIVNLFEDEENFDRLRACRTEQEVLDLIDRTNAAA